MLGRVLHRASRVEEHSRGELLQSRDGRRSFVPSILRETGSIVIAVVCKESDAGTNARQEQY